MAQQSSEGGLQPRRGRKDPALAADLARAETSGEVRRRRRPPVEPDLDPEPAELPEESPYEPPLDESGLINEPGEGSPDELPALYEGDIVLFRLSQSISLDSEGHEAWVSMGAQSRVQPEEDPQETVDRLRDFVIGELEFAADQSIEAHKASQARRDAERAAELRQPRGARTRRA